MKRRTREGVEQDVFTTWRRWYRWTKRAGVCARIKRNANRRERREAQAEIRSQLADETHQWIAEEGTNGHIYRWCVRCHRFETDCQASEFHEPVGCDGPSSPR